MAEFRLDLFPTRRTSQPKSGEKHDKFQAGLHRALHSDVATMEPRPEIGARGPSDAFAQGHGTTGPREADEAMVKLAYQYMARRSEQRDFNKDALRTGQSLAAWVGTIPICVVAPPLAMIWGEKIGEKAYDIHVHRKNASVRRMLKQESKHKLEDGIGGEAIKQLRKLAPSLRLGQHPEHLDADTVAKIREAVAMSSS